MSSQLDKILLILLNESNFENGVIKLSKLSDPVYLCNPDILDTLIYEKLSTAIVNNISDILDYSDINEYRLSSVRIELRNKSIDCDIISISDKLYCIVSRGYLKEALSDYLR